MSSFRLQCCYPEQMTKVGKSATELRALVLAEAISHPLCPRDIDVTIRPDTVRGWGADVISPNQIVYTDCGPWIGTIVQRLQHEYELQD